MCRQTAVANGSEGGKYSKYRVEQKKKKKKIIILREETAERVNGWLVKFQPPDKSAVWSFVIFVHNEFGGTTRKNLIEKL